MRGRGDRAARWAKRKAVVGSGSQARGRGQSVEHLLVDRLDRQRVRREAADCAALRRALGMVDLPGDGEAS